MSRASATLAAARALTASVLGPTPTFRLVRAPSYISVGRRLVVVDHWSDHATIVHHDGRTTSVGPGWAHRTRAEVARA